MTPELIEQVTFHFGAKKQIVKAVEEMSELQKELCKIVFTALPYEEIDNKAIIDELADVEIMCAQLRHIFGISDQVDKRKEFKINRLKERINQ